MQLFTNGVLVMNAKESFPGENGETVTFYKNYLKNPSGELLIANSTIDFTEYQGKKGVATLLIREREKGGYKVSLVSFTTGEIEEPESEIV